MEYKEKIKRSLSVAIDSFSVTERIVFYLFLAIFVVTTIFTLWSLNDDLLVEVPESGGKLIEGIVGSPRFVNPVLAISDADKDVATLVYSGLIKVGKNGEVIPDLAREFKISEDGRTYSFTLRDNIKFHDGSGVTTEDIEFTIQKIQDPAIKSPKRPAWEGVTITKTSPTEISFTLKQPYSPFIENLNIGILPKHIWKDVAADEFPFSTINIMPIGSGPYKIKSVERNSAGLPELYVLSAFGNYALDKPFINKITTIFYPNEKDLVAAYENGDIESMAGISPEYAKTIDLNGGNITETVLPRVFGVFFNQNQAAVLVSKEVRNALSMAVDKEKIVSEVLGGYGSAIDGPPYILEANSASVPDEETLNAGSAADSALASTSDSRINDAIGILTKAGWKINEETGVMEKKIKNETVKLAFSLSTGNVPELKRAAEIIQASWKSIGADVDLQVFETGDLNQNVIRPRKYDAIFFGEVVGRNFDLYPFWHSSQRNDPGLNIALYTNIKADKLLEEMRTEQDKKIQLEKFKQFEELVALDMPAVFVYSPHFIYVLPKKMRNAELGQITNANDRFSGVNQWYIDTNKIWKIFTR